MTAARSFARIKRSAERSNEAAQPTALLNCSLVVSVSRDAMSAGLTTVY